MYELPPQSLPNIRNLLYNLGPGEARPKKDYLLPSPPTPDFGQLLNTLLAALVSTIGINTVVSSRLIIRTRFAFVTIPHGCYELRFWFFHFIQPAHVREKGIAALN